MDILKVIVKQLQRTPVRFAARPATRPKSLVAQRLLPEDKAGNYEKQKYESK
jgi:hypothetical protein